MFIHLSERFNPDALATYTDLVSKGEIGGDYKVTDLAVDGRIFLSGGKLQPFLLGGIGAIQDGFNYDDNTGTFTTADALGDCIVTAGVIIPLGARVAAANDREAVVEAKCRIDQTTTEKRRNRWRT